MSNVSFLWLILLQTVQMNTDKRQTARKRAVFKDKPTFLSSVFQVALIHFLLLFLLLVLRKGEGIAL